MKDLIRRVRDANTVSRRAHKDLLAAIRRLTEASTQFPIGSTITLPDDDDVAPGSLATVMGRLLCISKAGELSWLLDVVIPDQRWGHLESCTWKPFVEEP